MRRDFAGTNPPIVYWAHSTSKVSKFCPFPTKTHEERKKDMTFQPDSENQYSASLGPTEGKMHYATGVRHQHLPKDTNTDKIMGEYELNQTRYPIAGRHGSEQG